jgi:phage terminase large subunit-like protein
MNDNPHLSDAFKASIKDKYQGTRFGAQEIEGKVSFDTEGALWTQELIDRTRARCIPISAYPTRQQDPLHFFERRIITVDPANTINEQSDDTGLTVMGLGEDGHAYLIESISKKISTLDLCKLIKDKYNEYDCDSVVVEVNNGGDWITSSLRTAFGRQCPYISDINAFEGKLLRARPVVAAHEQERVHLIGVHTRLEDELTNYDGDPKRKSPNLLDAFVYGVQDLLIDYQQDAVHEDDIYYQLPNLA